MKQDWSSPFTLECLDLRSGFCVYCDSKEASTELFRILKENGDRMDKRFHSTIWDNQYRCYRFSCDGILVRRGDVDCYETLYGSLPKFTFDPSIFALPDFDMSNAVSLLM